VPPLPVIKANVRNGNLSIGLGANHMCVIDDNMTLTCYGHNAEYEIGDGTNFDRPSGVTLTGLTSVDQVVAGRYHTCVRILANGGQMWCWGAGAKGQLGTGDNGVRGTPTNVAGIGTVTKIGAGEQHSCALNTSGQVYCWGWNIDGQVGNGQTQDVMTPTLVVSSGATDLVVGVRSTCAKIGVSDWKCWGRNSVGQLATGDDVNLLVPTTIQAFAGAATIAPGNDQACMLTATTVSCAGRLAAIGTGANSELFPQAPKLPSCQ
jgi:alpha-tubulin suppressor-like RCC1 family protein